MKWYVFALVFCLCGSRTAIAQQQPNAPAKGGHRTTAPKPLAEIIVGTVTDPTDTTVSGATVVLEGPRDHRVVVTNDDGYFQFNNLQPGTPYRLTISAKGFANWISPAVILKPNQYLILKGCRLKVAQAVTAITVVPDSPQKIATEQLKQQEKQRVFGVFPNFYVTYNPNPVPLTNKMKFRLALKTSVDPITILGIFMYAGIGQATNHPDYGQGAQGYAKRVGVTAADGFADIMIGGAILPSILHQDPRYFYQGTGTKKSRVLHALSAPFACKGDNGRLQPNYSSMGGNLATAALSNAYFPASDRGVGLVFGNFLIGTGQRMVAGVLQEFVLRKITPSAKKRKQTAATPQTSPP